MTHNLHKSCILWFSKKNLLSTRRSNWVLLPLELPQTSLSPHTEANLTNVDKHKKNVLLTLIINSKVPKTSAREVCGENGLTTGRHNYAQWGEPLTRSSHRILMSRGCQVATAVLITPTSASFSFHSYRHKPGWPVSMMEERRGTCEVISFCFHRFPWWKKTA